MFGFFRHEVSIDDAERHFARLNSVLVRMAVIAGLHQGRLYSAELLVRPWGRADAGDAVSSARVVCAAMRFRSR